MNPAPMTRGTVEAVAWDDGTRGWPLARLLVIDEGDHA